MVGNEYRDEAMKYEREVLEETIRECVMVGGETDCPWKVDCR